MNSIHWVDEGEQPPGKDVSFVRLYAAATIVRLCIAPVRTILAKLDVIGVARSTFS